MLIQTMDIANGLVNGARGVVTGFTGSATPPSTPPSAAADAPTGGSKRRRVEGAVSSLARFPIVRFVGGQEIVVPPATFTVQTQAGGHMSRRQVPLALVRRGRWGGAAHRRALTHAHSRLQGWALSVHKSQGMSLDLVEMDLSDVFETGQAYVALSRARSLQGLSLRRPLTKRSVRADPAVVAFYTAMAAQRSKEPAALSASPAAATATV